MILVSYLTTQVAMSLVEAYVAGTTVGIMVYQGINGTKKINNVQKRGKKKWLN